MKKLANDEKGMIIVEAAYVFPIVILITISLYFLAIFLYGRVRLQDAVNLQVDNYCNIARNACIKTTMEGNSPLTDPKNPYRVLFEDVTKNSPDTFPEDIKTDSARLLPNVGVSEVQARIEVRGVVFKEVVATASKSFVFPINLSFIGLPSEIPVSVSARRRITDHDELMRNVDIAIDLSSYLDDKYGITDGVKEIMSKVKGFFSKAS